MFGVCLLSVIPLRIAACDSSEMVSQVLFGEHFKILELHLQWIKIKLHFDQYEGWIDSKQMASISEQEFEILSNEVTELSTDLINLVANQNNSYTSILLGSTMNIIKILEPKLTFEGAIISGKKDKNSIIETAYLYLNAPYLWGGKTPFGIDCSGFTQMVYKLCGYALLRDASQQSTQGESLSFIEESEPGDLAFFDNEQGNIIHVGIILKDNYIIHASGQVRLDRLDHLGIYNVDTKRHSHKLRVIKKII